MSNTNKINTGGRFADMTVRQHYAANAMHALIEVWQGEDLRRVGREAVAIADSMLAAEQAGQTPEEPVAPSEPTVEQDLALMEDLIAITDRLRFSANKSAYELMDKIRDGRHGGTGDWVAQSFAAIARLRNRLAP